MVEGVACKNLLSLPLTGLLEQWIDSDRERKLSFFTLFTLPGQIKFYVLGTTIPAD